MICFETIKVENGKLLQLDYHQKRMNYTRKFFGFNDILELNKQTYNLPQKGIYRLRIDYEKDIKSFTCKEFTCREFKEFKIVESDIDYDYKYAQREILDALKKDEKETIIVKNGLITDTTIANIAIKSNGVWLTPKTPILKGTTRERLLDSGFLKCENLSIEDLKNAQNFAIMNALIGFYIIKEAKIEFTLGLERTI